MTTDRTSSQTLKPQPTAASIPRLGLCCIFRDEPIRFRTTTATSLQKLARAEQHRKLATLCRENATALRSAFAFCVANGIGCFRVASPILPVKTHPAVGYDLADLPDGREIIDLFQAAGRFARENNLRLGFHPDQYVVLNSPRPEVVQSSLKELEYQAEVAEWLGADFVNIHAGGAYGDKPSALARFQENFRRLSANARQRLTIENDDTTYTPSDLLPLCEATGIPLVYDAHHHRCLTDGRSIEETTQLALKTWTREPLFHISSPLAGWSGPQPERHHDFIDPADFPAAWLDQRITVEVEAKAKELAVLKLREDLRQQASPTPASAPKKKTASRKKSS